MLSAEQGDIVGMHWIGVFYHDGFGVSKDTKKAKEFLIKAADMGNCQSMYQLYMICSGNEGEDEKFKDELEAYNWLMKAISSGATFFDDAIKYFKNNFNVLAPIFLNNRGLDLDSMDETKKNDILNIHQAGITEM